MQPSNSKESQILKCYSKLALRIIESAYDDLDSDNSSSAEEFLNSDWYEDLAELSNYYMNRLLVGDYSYRFDMSDFNRYQAMR